ncbi:MAG: gluconate 2-dehydrogenase subunit 3 family protein [Acidobacteria bacterium]|nr:gluconate 2-dehydrogenase subunit 3 family protein [Acidobacteriota bacterium]
MKRRDFVKGFAVATATASTALGQQQPASNAAEQNAAGAHPAAPPASRVTARAEQLARFHTPSIPLSQPDLVATTEARYFTPVRYASLVHLCEIMMPAGDDYPSAMKAGTPEFLDFYIGASPADRQAMYNDGLDRLNADCMKQFKVPFAKADEKQADAVIRPHLKGWMNDHPPREGQERFVNLAHRDIREFTMNSPAWAAAAEASGERTPGVGLYWHPIDPGIQTWVSHSASKTASTTKHKQA